MRSLDLELELGHLYFGCLDACEFFGARLGRYGRLGRSISRRVGLLVVFVIHQSRKSPAGYGVFDLARNIHAVIVGQVGGHDGFDKDGQIFFGFLIWIFTVFIGNLCIFCHFIQSAQTRRNRKGSIRHLLEIIEYFAIGAELVLSQKIVATATPESPQAKAKAAQIARRGRQDLRSRRSLLPLIVSKTIAGHAGRKQRKRLPGLILRQSKGVLYILILIDRLAHAAGASRIEQIGGMWSLAGLYLDLGLDLSLGLCRELVDKAAQLKMYALDLGKSKLVERGWLALGATRQHLAAAVFAMFGTEHEIDDLHLDVGSY